MVPTALRRGTQIGGARRLPRFPVQDTGRQTARRDPFASRAEGKAALHSNLRKQIPRPHPRPDASGPGSPPTSRRAGRMIRGGAVASARGAATWVEGQGFSPANKARLGALPFALGYPRESFSGPSIARSTTRTAAGLPGTDHRNGNTAKGAGCNRIAGGTSGRKGGGAQT